MNKKDYYEVLGVNKNATPDEIKKAYRNQSKIHHPDKGGDTDKFKEISEAYEHLSDPNKKAKYDQFGHSDGYSQPNHGFDFESFFGKKEMVGNNINIILKLTLEEIFEGINKKYTYKRQVSCDVCSGEGGHNPITCNVCNGSGRTEKFFSTTFGYVSQTMECENCSGTGKTVKDVCVSCHGHGVKTVDEELNLQIPSGVQEGMTFPMKGRGHAIKNGKYGDLFITIQEIPHRVFTRVNNDLKMKLNLSFPQMVLGDKVTIETIGGSKIIIDIPPYSQQGDNLRAIKKGLNVFRGTDRGDLIISLNVSLPTRLDDDTKQQIEKLKNKV
jgi:molecular chaperone DnaJ